jgi:predicted metal-dependent HD superfamily phosphohydrolase
LFLVSNTKPNTDVDEICLDKSNDKHELTASQTERFLTSLNIPTCKCSTKKLKPTNTNHLSVDDNTACISLGNDLSINSFSSALNKKKRKPISIKRIVTFIDDLTRDVAQLFR